LLQKNSSLKAGFFVFVPIVLGFRVWQQAGDWTMDAANSAWLLLAIRRNRRGAAAECGWSADREEEARKKGGGRRDGMK